MSLGPPGLESSRMRDLVRAQLEESIQAAHLAFALTDVITEAAAQLVKALKEGHRVLVCGNGGSAADAQHFSSELVGRFEIERTPFFQAIRFDTIVGMFALPAWKGNRQYAGWHLLGLDHQPQFQPPFGYYDAEANARR